MEKIDVAIAGGGIVGLWTAFEVLCRKPDLHVAVFEKETFWGEHSSGRNSEVLHAGLYYPINSLKNGTCFEGAQIWKDFLKPHPSLIKHWGKLVVAQENELISLEKLFQHAKAAGAIGVKMLSVSEASKFKNEVQFHTAFFSPDTSVVDASLCLKLLRQKLEEMGCILLKDNLLEVQGIEADGFILKSNQDTFKSNILINSTGLYSTQFRNQLGLTDFESMYVRGHYLQLKKKLEISHLVYPVPPAHGHGLGVHLTINCQGDQKLGPNTEPISDINYSQSSAVVDEMYPSIKILFPSIQKTDLSLHYAGVRSKVKKNNELQKDFILQTEKDHGIKNYFEFLGIESPGFTASPSLAKMMVNQLF
jgi:L-2-hydroxyglutarate oxidase LhgO